MSNPQTPHPGYYIARRACGCVVAACVDRPEWKKDTAKDIADWIRSGLQVSHVDSMNDAPMGFKCPECRRAEGLDVEQTAMAFTANTEEGDHE